MPPKVYIGVANPSSLSYRERVELIDSGNTAEHHRLWVQAYKPGVWDRLLEDASTRSRQRQSLPNAPDSVTALRHTGTLSGYASNTAPAVHSMNSFNNGHNSIAAPHPTSLNHPWLSKRFMHKDKIEYMAAIRPDCETMNQTLRMMGTYPTDAPHAARCQLHMPPLSPAIPPGAFHPDVRISSLACSRAQATHNSLIARPHHPPSACAAASTYAGAAATATTQLPAPDRSSTGHGLQPQAGAAGGGGPGSSRPRPSSAAPVMSGRAGGGPFVGGLERGGSSSGLVATAWPAPPLAAPGSRQQQPPSLAPQGPRGRQHIAWGAGSSQ
ncbi:hypothetical protein V8C86DRAFT_2704290 [Haematococcus lacustris]